MRRPLLVAGTGSIELTPPRFAVDSEDPPFLAQLRSRGNGILHELGTVRRDWPTSHLCVQTSYELGELLACTRDLTTIGIGALVTSGLVTPDGLRAALPDPMGLGAVLDGWLRLCQPQLLWELPLPPSAWVVGAIEHSTLAGFARRLGIPLHLLRYRVDTAKLAGGVGLQPAGTILRYTRALLMGVLVRKYPIPGETLAKEHFRIRYRSISEAFHEAFGHTLERTRTGWGWERLAVKYLRAIQRPHVG